VDGGDRLPGDLESFIELPETGRLRVPAPVQLAARGDDGGQISDDGAAKGTLP
jgi:hypothetical protein